MTPPYGQIAVSWRLEGETLQLEVTVPANTTATLELPEGYKLEAGEGRLEAGTYTKTLLKTDATA